MFISRPFSFSTSWSFRCQSMFSWLTGRGREAKGTGMCQVHTHLTCCRLHRKWLCNYFHPIYYFHFSASCRWSETGPLSGQHLENLLCGQWMEWDTNHPQDQPDFSDNGRALLSRSKSHINTLHNLVFCPCFSLLTYYSVMFRCCSSLTSLWGTPCQPWSAPHKHTLPHTVWFCAMGWQPRCGSASGFCRYICHYSSSLTSCFFPVTYKKIQVLAQSQKCVCKNV